MVSDARRLIPVEDRWYFSGLEHSNTPLGDSQGRFAILCDKSVNRGPIVPALAVLAPLMRGGVLVGVLAVVGGASDCRERGHCAGLSLSLRRLPTACHRRLSGQSFSEKGPPHAAGAVGGWGDGGSLASLPPL